ncbi:hypothetical protein BC834DRAFT_1044335 [Gloeopeniophorella convolvens]|nr:hypothetical protein BC834DRAFT_1044335 [Gloeopeniophorella convolvens]
MNYSQPSANLTSAFPHNMDYLFPESAPECLEPGNMGPAEVEYNSNTTLPTLSGYPHPTSLLSELPDFAGLNSANIGGFGSVPSTFDATSYNVATNNRPAPAFNAPGFCDGPTHFGGDATPPVPYTTAVIPQVSSFDFSFPPHVNGACQAVAPVRNYQWESSPLSNLSSYGIPSASGSLPLESSGLGEPDQTTCIRPSWLSTDDEGAGWYTEEELHNMRSGYLPPCGSTHALGSSRSELVLLTVAPGTAAPAPAPSIVVPAHGEVLVPPAVLRKRTREDNEAEDDGTLRSDLGFEEKPPKKAKPTTSRATTTKRVKAKTGQPPIAKTLKDTSDKSESAGSGAERLAATASQGVYRQSLPGPNGSREMAGTRASEASASAKRGEKGRKKAQQDSGEDEKEDKMPKKLSERHRALLDAPQELIDRREVKIIRCKLCPTELIKKWRDFKRHCDCSEEHPKAIHPCMKCGDCFGRPDACKRHFEDSCTAVWSKRSRQKIKIAKKILKKYNEEFDKWVKTGEPIKGGGWAERMREEIQDTSKWTNVTK